ncbi:hypothetical protein BC826DRAFT_1175478 [Russula brevipes]|nr:hypothetical protein BC826DRAFT_1175478 [Russula brevipes]
MTDMTYSTATRNTSSSKNFTGEVPDGDGGQAGARPRFGGREAGKDWVLTEEGRTRRRVSAQRKVGVHKGHVAREAREGARDAVDLPIVTPPTHHHQLLPNAHCSFVRGLLVNAFAHPHPTSRASPEAREIGKRERENENKEDQNWQTPSKLWKWAGGGPGRSWRVDALMDNDGIGTGPPHHLSACRGAGRRVGRLSLCAHPKSRRAQEQSDAAGGFARAGKGHCIVTRLWAAQARGREREIVEKKGMLGKGKVRGKGKEREQWPNAGGVAVRVSRRGGGYCSTGKEQLVREQQATSSENRPPETEGEKLNRRKTTVGNSAAEAEGRGLPPKGQGHHHQHTGWQR